MAFTNEQLERYSRHIILKEVGVEGQKKLMNAKVLIIAAEGRGSDVQAGGRHRRDGRRYRKPAGDGGGKIHYRPGTAFDGKTADL